jgi:hypothetical protein
VISDDELPCLVLTEVEASAVYHFSVVDLAKIKIGGGVDIPLASYIAYTFARYTALCFCLSARTATT